MEIQSVTTTISRPEPAGPTGAGRAAGFSLIELMMTIAVATILLVIAIPSFQYVTNANRLASEVNGLLGDLQFARAEAIKEGRDITVCASTDGASCSGLPTDWQGGWIVFLDPTGTQVVPAGGSPLRIQSTFSGTDTFSATNNLSAVTFNRNGYAQGIAAGTIIQLHTTPPNNAWTRCVYVAPSGAVITGKYGPMNNGTVTCS